MNRLSVPERAREGQGTSLVVPGDVPRRGVPQRCYRPLKLPLGSIKRGSRALVGVAPGRVVLPGGGALGGEKPLSVGLVSRGNSAVDGNLP
jgi:hypothetical protein